MSQGDTGERGDTGQRGVSGERGPKGDHGQHGDVGLTGDIGERGDTGDKGERGDTGPEGRSTLLSRNIAVSYLLLAVVGALVLFVLGWNVVQNRNLIDRIDRQQVEIQQLAQSTHDSLCTFQSDLRRRRDNAVQYLKDHPRGVVSPVTNAVIITPAEIKQSIDNQNATLKALSGLRCPGSA